MSDLSYTNENNDEVRTSKFLKNRKTCCKTNCLHCPYGFTLKTHGLDFVPVCIESIEKANAIIKSQDNHQASLASSILASAFGSPKKEVLISDKNIDKYFFIKLKGIDCGVAKKGIHQLNKVYLKEHFTEQGLDLHFVNSLYEKNDHINPN